MLVIQNNGTIEVGALTLLGASTKDKDDIGKFGSGFKYALATLIREGVKVQIFSGFRSIQITTETRQFRDRAFEVLVIDGQSTSITTNTGPEWKVRDAIREIWSNALDEGDATHDWTTFFELHPDKTTIIIADVPEVRDMVNKWSMYFCAESEVIARTCEGYILRQPVPGFYRRGIWICEDQENTSIFGYNFKNVILPESRKIHSGSIKYPIQECLDRCTDTQVFRLLFENVDLKYLEWQAIQIYGLFNRHFEEAFREKWDFIGNIRNKPALEKVSSIKRVLWLGQGLYHILNKCNFPRVEDAFDIHDAYEVLPFPIGAQEKVDAAVALLASAGIDLSKFKIKFVKFKKPDQDIIALADIKTDSCLLTYEAFSCKETTLLKSLIEEWTHLEHRAADRTVEQQHVYLNTIVRLVKCIAR